MSGRKAPERLLFVDGYNVLNARRHLSGGAQLADARDALVHELQDYAGFSGQRIVLVFDAWQSSRMQRTVEYHGQVQVVFTQKGETADHYIERLCDDCAEDIEYRRVEVRVATSDALEHTIVLGRGATRLSARELLLEMQQVRQNGVERRPQPSKRSTVGDRIPEHIVRKMRAMVREGSEE